MGGKAGARQACSPPWLHKGSPIYSWVQQRMPFNTLCGFSGAGSYMILGCHFHPFSCGWFFCSSDDTAVRKFSWQFSKGKRRVLYSISSTWILSLFTASALQIFIDIIMPPLAIIYPSGNSTSLSILPHKSTPPAPVIISLLLSELSRVWQHLNKVPQTEGSSPPGHQSNYLPISWVAYAKKTLWPCGCHCGVQAHFSRVATSPFQNVSCTIATSVPFLS